MFRLAALVMLLCSCATSEGHPQGAHHPMRKGAPQPVYEFEPGPPVTDRTALNAWLEANRGKRLRLPVVLELKASGRSLQGARVGSTGLQVTDLALGIPLAERIAQACGREATRCALWLEGRYGEPAPFPTGQPQYEVLRVGEVVDESTELKAERAK